MIQLYNAPVEDIIKKRVSVRTYSGEAVSNELKVKIRDYISQLSNPFNVNVNFKLLESDTAVNSAKLGTYGIIKGATDYIGATVKDEDLALEALGYEFEKLILYITSLGLGTCWIGGTFKRSEFAKAMDVKSDELFPIISPFGHAADKRSLSDSLLRFASKGDLRKPWNTLFFDNSIDIPLSSADAWDYESPLEMVRMAPSASNKQPWRIVKQKNIYHFYKYKSTGYNQALGYDIQSIDMGIAACHFHLTAIEKKLAGQFKKLPDPIPAKVKEIDYIFSWISE